jgi:hypothetical protein
MKSMAFDEKECLTSTDRLAYKKGVATQWARKRLKELTEKEKTELYKDLLSDSD